MKESDQNNAIGSSEIIGESAGSFSDPIGSSQPSSQKGSFGNSSFSNVGVGLDPDAHGLTDQRRLEILQKVGEEPEPLPLIGKLPIKTQYTISFTALLVSLGLVAATAGYGFLASEQNQTRAQTGTQIEMLTQRLLASAQYAVRGDKVGSDRLVESRKLIAESLANIEDGTGGVSKVDLNKNADLAALDKSLKKEIFPVVDRMIELTPYLSTLQKNNEELEQSMGSIFINSEQLISILSSNGYPPIYASAANHIRMLAERIRRNGSVLLTSTDIRIEPLSEFSSDIQNLQKTIDTLLKGDGTIGLPPVTDPQVVDVLKTMNENAVGLFRVSKFIEENAQSIVTSRRNLSALAASTETALTQARRFRDNMQSDATNAFKYVYISALFILGTIASLLLLGFVNNRATRREAWESAYKNEMNEQDIVGFMKDIVPLEMGDLTVRFTGDLQALEGITGGLRQSVNEATISLHEAVAAVKATTDDIGEVVTNSVRSSFSLQESNELQAKEIKSAVGLVGSLADDIEVVTDKTLQAADITNAATKASSEGQQIVSQTNEKMEQIRANMQDVLKSVKHLGETSHEIGQIVETIETITDRTQVLAVNASLEAAKAGVAGQGFQIIAAEVNRLAEQSSEALKTIVAMVQRVQGETATTIKTVEESTNNVVDGARLSKIANDKLNELNVQADLLGRIMTEIRSLAESQTTNAGEVRGVMDRLEVLSQNFQKTANSMVDEVQQIDASMGSLRNTVSTFTTEA